MSARRKSTTLPRGFSLCRLSQLRFCGNLSDRQHGNRMSRSANGGKSRTSDWERRQETKSWICSRPVLTRQDWWASTQDLQQQILKEVLQAWLTTRKSDSSSRDVVISLLGPNLRVKAFTGPRLIWPEVCFLAERLLSLLEELQALSAAVISSSEGSSEEEEEEKLTAQDDHFWELMLKKLILSAAK